MSRGLEAAFSTASLPGILSNIANKVLLEGFLQMDDTWKKIVKTASVNNFQQHTRYRMNGAFKFEKVGKDGELAVLFFRAAKFRNSSSRSRLVRTPLKLFTVCLL